jgi:hypothetical protein
MERDPDIHQGDQTRIEQTGLIEPSPHRPRAAKNRRPPSVEQVIQQRRSPLTFLSVEHERNIPLNFIPLDPFYPRHCFIS